jgi:hypothetical protein
VAEVSSVQAALDVFRRREQRFVLTSASVVYVIGSLVLGVAFMAAAWPAFSGLLSWYFQAMRAIEAGGEPVQPSPQMILALAPYYGVYTVAALTWFAAYEAACLRWLVRGERGGIFGFSFGADTWRVLLTYLLWIALGIGFCVVVGVFYGVLIGVSGAAPAVRIIMMLIGALAPLALAALLIWVATRLSPAAAASIGARKFAFFGAWKITRGRFWEMLGAFVILLAVYLAIATVLSALVRWPLSQVMYPLMADALAGGDLEALLNGIREAFTSPLMLGVLGAYALASIVLVCVLRAAWFGVNAFVVRLGAVEPPAPVGQAS